MEDLDKSVSYGSDEEDEEEDDASQNDSLPDVLLSKSKCSVTEDEDKKSRNSLKNLTSHKQLEYASDAKSVHSINRKASLKKKHANQKPSI